MKIFTKTLLVAISCSLICISTFGQNFEWAKRAGAGAFDYGRGVCVDSIGNVYVTGEFEFTAYFNSTPIVSAGLHDIFLAKYDPSGNLLWVNRAGGRGGDVGHGISIDAAGNVYITGEFEDTATFNNVTLIAHSVVNEIFIAKYNSSGALQWVKNAGGTNTDKGFAISADAAGNSYLTGWFNSWAYFGNTTLVSFGAKDIFVAKYNTNGDFEWAQQAGDTLEDEGKGISVDNFGNVYVTGLFTDKASFGSTTLTSMGSRDIFIAKYSASGILQWVKNAGGTSTDVGRAMTTDKNGYIYITGEFRGSGTFGDLSINSSGSSNIFIACYDPMGNAVWVKKAGGPAGDVGRGIDVDIFSNIYVTGDFSETAIFGDTTLVCNTDTFPTTDIFIASYDSNGEFRWAQKAGSDTTDSGFAVSADNFGNIYITGFYASTISFGNFSLNEFGHSDIFLAKYSEHPTNEPTIPSSNLNLTVINCNEIQATWTRGNGDRSLLVVQNNNPVNIFPIDGNGYIANLYWGEGSSIGGNNYVVYGDTGSSVIVTGLLPGTTYHFTVFEYNGSGFTSNYLTVNYPANNATTGAFNIATSFANDTICAGESTNLSASGATSYSWSPSDGLSNASIANPVASPIVTTTYTVTGTTNDCWNKANVTITVSCTGVDEITSINNVNIYPNPGKGNFTLQFHSDKRAIMKIKIFDLLGETVYSEQMNINSSNYSKSIGVEYLSDGVYMLQMETHEGILVHKLLIQK